MNVNIEDRLTQLKLRLLDDKLEKHKERIGKNKSRNIVQNDAQEAATFKENDLQSRSLMADLKLQLEEMKREQLRLRRQIESKKKYEERPDSHSSSISSRVTLIDDTMLRAKNPTTSSGGIDPVQNMMQMMMMQQQQMQSMVMSQMMLNNGGPQQQATSAPIIISSSQPQMATYPYYPPYPPYPNYMNDEFRNPYRKRTVKNRAPPLQKHDFPFPGNSGQQRLRRLTYAAFFCISLYRLAQEIKNRPPPESDRVNEVIGILHRIYLNPNGRVYPILLGSTIGYESNEFQLLLDTSSIDKESQTQLVQMLGETIEALTLEICNIMPINGVLGTNPNSGIYKMMMTSHSFPSDFFFNIERLVIALDEKQCIIQNNDASALVLLAGIFFMKALVKTLFMEPIYYGFIPDPGPHPTAQRNLQLLSSLFTYIFRQLIANSMDDGQATKKKKPVVLPNVPTELVREIIPDEILQPVLVLCKTNLDNCEAMMSRWAQEYFSRLVQVKP